MPHTEPTTLEERFTELVRASFTGIVVKSHEHTDALRALMEVISENRWSLVVWDSHRGVQPGMGPALNFWDSTKIKAGKQPLAFLGQVEDAAAFCAQGDNPARNLVVVMKNCHHQATLGSPVFQQALVDLVEQGKLGYPINAPSDVPVCNLVVVLLSHEVKLPEELAKHFTYVSHELPTKEQLWTIMENTANDDELPAEGVERKLLLEAAAGLTRNEAENAVSLSIIRTGKGGQKSTIDPDIIWDIKSKALREQGILEIYDGDASFEQMGGLDEFRSFTTDLLVNADPDPLVRPKGLLLLGVPGSGKTQSVRCLGNATGRRVLQMRMGQLRSKWQGESDGNIDRALAAADAMAPCILFVDEIEKALSGIGGSGDTDGGTGNRMFGRLLEWLNDHTTDVFFACTCNDISKIMDSNPEFVRAERFDGMFFFDIPEEDERFVIWQIYLSLFKIPDDQRPRIDQLVQWSEGWTGAEIRACCRLTRSLRRPMEQVRRRIVPIARTADAKLGDLQEWAKGKCSHVRYDILYGEPAPGTSAGLALNGVRRRIDRDDSGKKKKKRVRKKRVKA